MTTLLLFNKPFNVLTQFTDADNRATLKDYISMANVYPAGRLDRDSEGLLLLTDSGSLQHLIANPLNKMAKTYWVQVEHIPTDATLARLAKGVELKDGKTLPAQVKRILPPAVWSRQPPIRERQQIPTQWLALTIYEGKNRQVRRMTAAVGHPTLRLIRYQIGPWTLDQLKPGESHAVPEVDVLKWQHDLETKNNRSRRGGAKRSIPAGRRTHQRQNDTQSARRPPRAKRKSD